MNHLEDLKQLQQSTLQHFWGFKNFREPQEEIINAVIQAKDTIVLLPTGGGKSLCYQLPALVLEGVCIVISPLLALMKDQVIQLKRKGIEAEFISSELDEIEAEFIYSRCKEGITKLLYISPERITNQHFLENTKDFQISFLAVDEAHCISEWGQDFRPSYQNIKHFRETFEIPCIALTATATPKVLVEIQQKLGLKNPEIFQKSFKRNNIKIYVDEVSDKYQSIYNFLKFNSNSGIIYTRTRKEAEQLTHFLQRNKIKNVDFFHAGLTSSEKNKKQNLWMTSSNQVMISTNAFGMGIDKENVNFVIHYSPSASLENYYQEIGRAGRNGNLSYAIHLWNEQELLNIDDIYRNQIPDKNEFSKVVSFLYSLFQIAEHETSETVHQLHLNRIQSLSKVSLAKIKNIISFLHQQEVIYHNSYSAPSSLELLMDLEEISFLPKKDAYFAELLLRSLPGLTTHKVSFNEGTLAQKLASEKQLIKERILELQQQKVVNYIDGSLSSVKFLKPRNSREIEVKYWSLFKQIQTNKLQKWEDFKFYLRTNDYCKMRLILSYFGEKKSEDCGKCSYCEKKKKNNNSESLSEQILEILRNRPSSIDEIAYHLQYYQKEKILEQIILLLDLEKVKMLDFRTYAIA